MESDRPAETNTANSEKITEKVKIDNQKEIVSASGKSAQILVEKDDYQIFEDLHSNDNKVLALLTDEKGSYSFKGLMRRLNLHQQSLSRALRRLEELGLVEKSAIGYKLSKNGQTLNESLKSLTAKEGKKREYMQLLQTQIPINVRSKEIVRSLIGKWFKNLRWIGLVESETGYMLQWTSDDNSYQINLRMVSNYIVIEANAFSEKEKVEAMVGSYAIYEQITRVFQQKLEGTSIYMIDPVRYVN